MNQVSATSSSTGTSGSSSTPQNPLAALGKDDFLRLLVTQLKYQDPMSPTDNQQFMSQMAQFSMVEGINNLQSTMTSLQGVGLIGKQITYTTPDGSEISGLATSVAMSGGSYTVHVGSEDVDPGAIIGVAAPPEPTVDNSTTDTTETSTTSTTETPGGAGA